MANIADKAKQIAHKYHSQTPRMSGITLFDHVSEVAEKLKKARITDPTVLASAYLHHLPEAEPQYYEIIKTHISEDAAEIVKTYSSLGYRNITSNINSGMDDAQVLKIYMNLSQDIRVLLIRLADKTQNIETAFALSSDKKLKVAENALFVYAPLARLLGLGYFSRILEDGAFKILNPHEYLQLQSFMEIKVPQVEQFFKETTPVLIDLLKERGIKTTISHRIKHIYGVFRKMQKYGTRFSTDINIEHVHDIAAMRIIVPTVEDIYKTEDLLISLWDQIPELRDDYVTKPRPSGYQSLHNSFKVAPDVEIEVQIRTQEMHDQAEFGSYSHVFYKLGDKFKKELEANPNWVRELNYYQIYKKLKSSKLSEDKNANDSQKLGHFSKYVYCFTPKGDIIEMTRGATVLDFAFHVHTELGNKCAGAKINGGIVKLDTPVNDGDVVEILTDKSRKKPSQDWLNIVKTKKGRWSVLKGLR